MEVLAHAPTRDLVALRIAEGGTGYIELVQRREGRFSRLLARKRLHPHLRADAAFRSMLLDEARLAALVRHPNVTAVLEVGEDADGPFFLMDYVEGLSVAQILECLEPRERLLPLAACVGIVAQAARGLYAAHSLVSPEGVPLAVVHRDISPKNLLVGYDGLVRVVDFGIAKARDNIEQTRLGVLKGNIGYMSPEYLSFRELDGRSDLFPLGVVLYELLARERLYGGTDTRAIARRILEEPPPDIFEVRDVPPELTALLFELLAKDRELRPPNALAVANQLDAIAASLAGVDGPFDLGEFLVLELASLRQQQRAAVEAALARMSAAEPSSPAAALARAGAGGARTSSTGSAASSEAVMGEPASAANDVRPAPERALLPGPGTRSRRLVRAAQHRPTLIGVALALLALAFVLRPRWFGAPEHFTPGEGRLWAGGWHTCALRQGELVCWGSNERGQLGDGTAEDRSLPVAIPLSSVRALAMGERHTCELGEDGRVACWGRNMRGEAGSADPSPVKQRHTLEGLTNVSAVAAGRQHTCALDSDGGVTCWGANTSGQLGRPPFDGVGVRARVEGLPPAERLFAGGANTCVLLRKGGLRCWGANESGQLGGNGREPRVAPAPIAGTQGIVRLAINNNSYAGSKDNDLSKIASFMCGCTEQGGVLCWGNNYTAQLGDGTRSDRPTPAPVLGVEDVIDVSAGDVHACALHRSGKVSCWGRNEFGAVGDGSMGPSTVRLQAVVVPGIDDAVGIDLGDAHSCVRHRNGEISCWGVNNYGQLGDGTLILRPSPGEVARFP